MGGKGGHVPSGILEPTHKSVVTMAELSAQTGELLPAREALALINISVPVVVGVGIAVNAVTFNSQANALVGQFVTIG